MQRRLRMGMIGGGPGSFIGPVHRLAAELDREIELVAGAFSSDPARSAEGGASYGIDPARAYPTVEAMVRSEASRGDGIDFVSIVSPNFHHHAAAMAALDAGLAVMCDKPLTAGLADAEALRAKVAVSALPFAVSYTYSGYPMVREARARIAAGEIGAVRKVVVEYPQGWLAGAELGKQAEWRLDPARAGLGGCIADIGVHAFHLAEFITGAQVTRILADLAAVVPGRLLDDDCTILLRFANGARGVLLASQIEVGELNGLRIRIYGETGAVLWAQEDANCLQIREQDGRIVSLRSGTPAIGSAGAGATRLPGGHPEGYLEAFGNLYRDFVRLIRGAEAPLLPTIEDGYRGMNFIETAVTASRDEQGWVTLQSDRIPA